MPNPVITYRVIPAPVRENRLKAKQLKVKWWVIKFGFPRENIARKAASFASRIFLIGQIFPNLPSYYCPEIPKVDWNWRQNMEK